ncbi:c-type cytochrome [Roseateles oligotrophus]|uniref:C-type cytochrome n=1 Tax=Roseateles oligotrophus TaxID=1769250 RepID=A0ABT2YM27_9BURK|nr:c-type cytochrome [Roseateles oligotrophus]MCV2371099.1 c-type cytochrome [Roseateles oligotrophus]
MSAGRIGLTRKLLVICCVALSAASPPTQAAPDVVRGEQLYGRCIACHAMATDRVGPRHCGLLGRRAGSVADFEYSAAMKKSNIVWDEKALDLFLKKPLAMLPGSSMTYDGVPEARDRADLIAYLKSANSDAACRNLKSK